MSGIIFDSMGALGRAAGSTSGQSNAFGQEDPTLGLPSPGQGNGAPEPLSPLSPQGPVQLDQDNARDLRQKMITQAAEMRRQAGQMQQQAQPAPAADANGQPQPQAPAATAPPDTAQLAQPDPKADPKTLSPEQLAPMVQKSAKDLKAQWEALTQAQWAAHAPVNAVQQNLYGILKKGNADAVQRGPAVLMDISEFTHKRESIPITPEASRLAQDALRELRAQEAQQKGAMEQADNATEAFRQGLAAHKSLAQTLQDKQSAQQEQQLAELDRHPVTKSFADELRQLAADTQQYLSQAAADKSMPPEQRDAAQQAVLNEQRPKEQEILGRLNGAIKSHNDRVNAQNREITLHRAGQQMYDEERAEHPGMDDSYLFGAVPTPQEREPWEEDWVTRQIREGHLFHEQQILEQAGTDRKSLDPYVLDAAKMDFARHGEPAVVLNDGSIRVSPALWLNPKAYKEAVESVAPASGAAKMEALEAFHALSQQAGADLAHQAANVPQINEVLQSMPGNTPEDKALAFAEALRTKSGFWDKLNARVSGAVDANITSLIPSVFSALYGAGAAIGLPTKGLQKDAQASAQYWKERGQTWDWVANGIPSDGSILGAISDQVTDLAGSGTSMLPMLVGGEFAPLVGAAQELGRSYTDAFDAYVRQGKSEDEARRLALIPAVTNAAIDFAAFKIPGPKGIKSVFSNPTTAKEAITASLKQMARNVGVTSSFEFGRMGVDSMAKDVVHMLTDDPNMTVEDALGRAFQSGLSGAQFGGFMHVVHHGMETLHDRAPVSPAAGGDSNAGPNGGSGLNNSGGPAQPMKQENGALVKPAAEDPVMRASRFAAAEASLQDIADPRSQMKAKALLEIAKGNVQGLTRTQLQSVGLDWKGAELVDAPQKASQDNPSPEEQMAYAVNGKPVIRDDAVQWLKNENVSPTAAKAISMDEPTARQKALKQAAGAIKPGGDAEPLLNAEVAEGTEVKENAAGPSSMSEPASKAPTQQPAEPSVEGSNSRVSPAKQVTPSEQVKQWGEDFAAQVSNPEHKSVIRQRAGMLAEALQPFEQAFDGVEVGKTKNASGIEYDPTTGSLQVEPKKVINNLSGFKTPAEGKAWLDQAMQHEQDLHDHVTASTETASGKPKESAPVKAPETANAPSGPGAPPERHWLEKWADDTIKEGRQRLNTGLDPELLAAYATKGAFHIARGLRDFTQWSSQMLSEFGESIRPHLEKLWTQAEDVYHGQIQPEPADESFAPTTPKDYLPTNREDNMPPNHGDASFSLSPSDAFPRPEYRHEGIPKEIKAGKCLPHITNVPAFEEASDQGAREATNYLQAYGDNIHTWGVDEIGKLHKAYFGPLYRHAGAYRRPGELAVFGGRVGADGMFIGPELDLLKSQLSALHQSLPPLTQDAGMIERLEMIAFHHARLVLIHPFQDGNGRLSRLISAHLDKQLLPGLSLVEVPKEHYSAAMKALPKNLAPLMKYYAARHGWSLELPQPWQPPFPTAVTKR